VPALREVQAAVRTALLGGDEEHARRLVAGDGLAIHRHHVVTTLTDVLADAFPVVRRLVDARFFAYAADTYLRDHPPAGPCLFEYGATFPDFLATFPPCRALAYLPDVARLEWAIHAAFHAEDVPALEPESLVAVPEDAAARLIVRMHPSVAYLRSPWAIDRIWEAHQENGRLEDVRLEADEVRLEVRRTGEDVVFARLPPAVFVFRRALAAGRCLGEAVAEALVDDATFDLPAALAALLGSTLVAGFGIQGT
jgi:hypothetical protein